MSREHWSSDEENAVDLLVQACNKPRASLEAPAQPHLIGRELTPYFSSSDELPALAPAKPEAPNGHGQKTSSKRKNASPQHASSRPRSAGQQSPVTTSKKTHEKKSSSAGSSSEDEAAQQRSRKAPKASSPVPVLRSSAAAPSSPPPSFSCPGAFRASPKPETLPIPSSSLLLRAYHQAPLRLAVIA